jgi:hypothetical protein
MLETYVETVKYLFEVPFTILLTCYSYSSFLIEIILAAKLPILFAYKYALLF